MDSFTSLFNTFLIGVFGISTASSGALTTGYEKTVQQKDLNQAHTAAFIEVISTVPQNQTFSTTTSAKNSSQGYNEKNMVALTPSQIKSYKKGNRVVIDKKEYTPEFLFTKEQQEKGLSERKELLHSQVTLFIFEEPTRVGFWMKGMRFPIDICWLDEAGRVIQVESNVSPRTYPKIFYPTKKASIVIEASSGVCSTLRAGDFVYLTQ